MTAMASSKVFRLPPLPTIGDILRLYKLSAQKHLAQNFILDMNLTNKIVRTAGKIGDGIVCEVGPGPGGLTRSILNAGCRQLITIEKDRRFLPSLEILNEASNGRVRIYQGDILQFNMDSIFPIDYSKSWDDYSPNLHIIGNLPFNVSTPLIIKWLEAISNRSGAWNFGRVKLTLTFQKEVAERMTAPIVNRQRCRLSIMCQHLCEVEHKFTIPGKAFVPKPEVDVAVVHFVPRKEPLIKQPFEVVEKIARHIFHFRQKPCRKGAQTLFPPDKWPLSLELLKMADIDPDTKPYCISMEEFSRLCDEYYKLCQSTPGLFNYDYRSAKSAQEIREFRKKRSKQRKMAEKDGENTYEDVDEIDKILLKYSLSENNLGKSL